MRNSPKETVDCWLRQTALDPRRLIPALLQQCPISPSSISKPEPNHAIRYLNHLIFSLASPDPTIHNLLLTLHASSPITSSTTDSALLNFLKTAPTNPATDQPFYDLDYALRTCKGQDQSAACVVVYEKMGLWESGVDLALKMGDVDLAMRMADRGGAGGGVGSSGVGGSGDEAERKRLWLKIAKFVVGEQKDIKKSVDCRSTLHDER